MNKKINFNPIDFKLYPGKPGPAPQYATNLYSKLAFYGMKKYDRILLTDTDIIWRRNPDDAFKACSRTAKFCGIQDLEKTGGPNYMNTGLFVLKPNQTLLDDMKFLLPNGNYDPVFPEQNFLNWYFDKEEKEVIDPKLNIIGVDYCTLNETERIGNLHFKFFDCYEKYKDEIWVDCGFDIDYDLISS